MTELRTQITVVRLARGRVRLFAAPAAFLVISAGLVAGGLLAGGPAGISLVAIGALAALAAAYLAALVSSYRLQVEPGALKLRWLGGERRYTLMRGPVTRVVVRGAGAAALHPRFGAFGWAVGPAVLRGEESIEVIRLSAARGLILVPTDRGRLAIAAHVENDLLAALTSAVRLQERLDQIATRRSMSGTVLALSAPTPPAAPPPPVAPRVLTGIERTLIEQRLAAERAVAQSTAGAELAAPAAGVVVEPQPAAAAVEAPPGEDVPAERPSARIARQRERAQWQRPRWLAVPGPASVAAALPVALPLIGGAIAWMAVTLTGRPVLPSAETRLLLVGLALVGPLGAVGALMARTWYPRLSGLVIASAIAGLAMLTRTILA
jgi:hypothetical protein